MALLLAALTAVLEEDQSRPARSSMTVREEMADPLSAKGGQYHFVECRDEAKHLISDSKQP